MTLRFVAYNIQYAKGQDEVFDLGRIAATVADCDVVCLQEVEAFLPRSGDVDQAEELGRLLPRHHWVYGPGLDVDGSIVAADGTVTRRRRRFGNMVLSRFPIRSTRTFMLPKVGSVTAPSLQRTAVEAVIDVGPAPIRVYSVHLDHVGPGTRLPQVDHLLDVIRRAPAEGGAFTGTVKTAEWLPATGTPMPRAAVVMGDMNMDNTSEEYARFVGPREGRHGRLVSPDGFADAFVVAGHDEDSGVSHMNGRRIDHCFVSTILAPAVTGARIDTDNKASDHYPLFVDLDPARIPADPLATLTTL